MLVLLTVSASTASGRARAVASAVAARVSTAWHIDEVEITFRFRRKVCCVACCGEGFVDGKVRGKERFKSDGGVTCALFIYLATTTYSFAAERPVTYRVAATYFCRSTYMIRRSACVDP